jgi:eukaryotic-like serine/threonine-protein kinase
MAQPKSVGGEDRGSELHAQRRASALQRVGQTVAGGWHLDALVGLGGSAAVYAATHRDGRPPSAIKMLHADLSVLPMVGRRFLREAYVANRVGHPGAPVVFDDGTSEEGLPFLVLELLKGRSLDVRGREGPAMSVGEVLSLARAVLDILAAAHAQAIVHRDVKPSNIFLAEGGGVHLLDFGIARMRAADEVGEVTTQSGLLIGTPQFMAPEQARGHSAALDARTDLWALGAVMFWLLTGRYVHVGATALEIVIASATRPAPRLGPAIGGAVPALAPLVDRALAFNPAARWANARAMQAAIDAVEKGLSAEDREARPGVKAASFAGESSPPTLDEIEAGHSDEAAIASKPAGRPSGPAPGGERPWVRWGVPAGAAAALAASLYFGSSAGAGRWSEGAVGAAASGGEGGAIAPGARLLEAPGAAGGKAAEGGAPSPGAASAGEKVAAAASEAPKPTPAPSATSGQRRVVVRKRDEGKAPGKPEASARPAASAEDPLVVPDSLLDRWR